MYYIFSMRMVSKILIGILCATVSLAPCFAADKKCNNRAYRQNNPSKCKTAEKADDLWTIALVGGAAVAGAGIALAAMSAGGNDGSTTGSAPGSTGKRILVPTMKIYDTVGYTDPNLLATAMSATEYGKNLEHYNEIRLAYSLARGFTGKNSTIAVLDTGDYSWHGTAVANIAGNAIAPNATINSYKIVNDNGDFLSYAKIGEIIESEKNAKIFNSSWGITTYNNISAASVKSRTQLVNLTSANFIDNITSAATARDAIFVWSAGNDGTKQSNALSAMGKIIPELSGHFINVVAWDTATGELAEYSNACGVTQLYCITAPGSDVNIGRFEVSGTSFAAPMVAGAVAVISEAFPYMTANEITQLIFTTARDLGADGNDEIYGWGMLDLERATRPVGAALVPLGDGMTPLRMASASGTMARKLKSANLQFAFFDSFGRAFTANLNDNISFTERGRGFDRLRADDPRVTFAAGNFEFGFSNENLLVGDGFLQTDQNNLISFVGLKNEFNIGEISFFQNARVGFSAPRAASESFISGLSNIYSASAKFGAAWHDWTLSISTPETIIGGAMNMNLPYARAANGDILFANYAIDLAERPALEYSIKYKFLTTSFIDNPLTRDEFFIMAKTKIAF